MPQRPPTAVTPTDAPPGGTPRGWPGAKRWVRSFYAFDDRLAERIENSRACTASALIIAWVWGFFVIFVIWDMWVGPDKKVITTAVFALVLLSLVPLAMWRMRAQLANQRRKAGQCVSCGYDRRRSPYYCPECGAAN